MLVSPYRAPLLLSLPFKVRQLVWPVNLDIHGERDHVVFIDHIFELPERRHNVSN